jgi:signal transduction histidine kinase/CheY-like chemotaxis protein
VSRPANFAGRDYFQDQQKNPADIIMIGRPFGTAPNQHASIPISRRLTRPDGSFGGVVVAGVHLTWLSDLLSQPIPGLNAMITVRRSDGLILMRSPYDPDAIGRGATGDPAWQSYVRTGQSPLPDDPTGIHVFRATGAANLVLELALASADIDAGQHAWLPWLPALALIPGLCVLILSLAARRLLHRGDRIAAAAGLAHDETMRLLANMSHELRTPLTGVLGQAEMLSHEGSLTEGQASRLQLLTAAGSLMRNIIDRVVNVARPDDVIETPDLTPCDLDLLLQVSLGVVEGEARRKGLLLSSNIHPDAPRRAMLEADRVKQMLNNLLMNAVKFTRQGTVALHVTGNATHLRFAVADTGPGVPAGKRHRLFRAFDRLDVPDPRAEGNGLGLSITERLARRMGGRVGFAENPGGGSIFWFELPLIEPVPGVVPAQQTAPQAAPPEFRHLRVLLADDLDLTRGVTADFLRSGGHMVTEASNGEAAIEMVRQHDFDVVLTDMRMPVVDGLEVARRIRALPGHRGRTPIVLVTADLMALRAGEAGQCGIDIGVRKPFTRAELLAAVATAARLSPVPDVVAVDHPVLDHTALAELRQCSGDLAFGARLDEATCRIAGLLTLLDRPDAPENPTLREAVHDLIGVAGLMGLPALAATLRWFDTAADRTAPAAAVHEAAQAALCALRRQREPAAAHR